MKRIHVIAGIAIGLLIYGLMGTSDLEAQERAEEYAQETRAAARADAIRLARELRMQGAFDEGMLTRPVGEAIAKNNLTGEPK